MVPFLTFLILFLLIRNLMHNDLKMIYEGILIMDVVLLVMWPQGFFIKFGDNGISSCQTIVELALLICSILFVLRYRIKIPVSLMLYSFLWIICIAIGIMSEIVDPIDFFIINEYADWDSYVLGIINKTKLTINWKEQIIFYSIIVNYIINIWILKTAISESQMKRMMEKITVYLQLALLFGMVEFIVSNIAGEPTLILSIKDILFLSETNFFTTPNKRGNFYGLSGVTSEPSHYVMSLFLIGIFVLIRNKIITRNGGRLDSLYRSKCYMFLIMVIMYFTGGFSAVWYIAMLMIANYIIRNEYRNVNRLLYYIKYVLILLIIMGTCLYVFYNWGAGYIAYRLELVSEIINAILSNNLGVYSFAIDSTAVRLISCYDVFNDFLQRPLFGLGIGIEEAHNEFSTMLSYFGIIGIIVWGFMINFKDKYDISLFVLLYLIAGIPIGFTHMHLPMINVSYAFLYETTKLYDKEGIGKLNDT